VGKTTFPGSLSCLRPRGLFVSFGNASGPVPPFPLAELNNHGSLFATRPKLNDYVSTRKELLEGADTLFAAVINGKLHVPINHAYALKDAARAHIDLEGRATTGAARLRRAHHRCCWWARCTLPTRSRSLTPPSARHPLWSGSYPDTRSSRRSLP